MKRKSRSVMNGKGFYIALALSIAMVGAACYFAYTQTSDDFTQQLELSSALTQPAQNDYDVANVQTDVPKHTQKVTQAVTSHTKPYTETVVTAAMESEAEEVPETEETLKHDEAVLSMPIDGEIISEYSNGELVKSSTTGAWQTHNGIDIKATEGDAVMAADDGKVSAVENDALWGVTVTIDHGNGIVSRYCNLNSGVTVQAGQEVSGGEEIGAVGNTADIESSEDTHLHFEIIKNGSYANPLELIRQ